MLGQLRQYLQKGQSVHRPAGESKDVPYPDEAGHCADARPEAKLW